MLALDGGDFKRHLGKGFYCLFNVRRRLLQISALVKPQGFNCPIPLTRKRYKVDAA
jgi:hypothetical protein